MSSFPVTFLFSSACGGALGHLCLSEFVFLVVWATHLQHCLGICKSHWNDFCINIYVLRSQLYKIFVLLSSECQSSPSSLRLRFPWEWEKNIFSEKADFSFVSDASESKRNETRAKKLTLWFHRLSGRVFWADVSMRQRANLLLQERHEKKIHWERTRKRLHFQHPDSACYFTNWYHVRNLTQGYSSTTR